LLKENPMIRLATLCYAIALCVSVVNPIQAAFVNGNLVVLTTASNTGTAASAITLNVYPYNSLTGTFGTTPTSHSIAGLTLPGEADHDGLLHLSTNGNSLTFGGYQADAGTPSVIASAATRAIGVVDSNWNLTTTAITGYTGVALRSVVSTDGQHFWTGGDQGTSGGQYYVDASGGPVTQTLITANDARGNRIDGGQLWAVSSTNGGTTIGAGLPTTLSASTAAMTSPFVKSDVVFLDLDNNGISETAYTTDGKNLLGKWHSDGVNWSLTGSWTGAKANINDINSLEAFVFNGNVEILAATQLGRLFQLTDTNGIAPNFDAAFLANTTPSPFLTLDGSSFRGMAITVPEPTTWTLLALAAPFIFWFRRSKARYAHA
jgi:hypothetical protein